MEEKEYAIVNKLFAIMDAAVDAIICINDKGIVELYNQAAVRIFQYEANEVIGNKIDMLMPEPFKSEHDSYMQQ
jgi:PAS domain S-box-containing protein